MASVRDIVAQGDRAFNDHDREALRRLYADDARLIAPGGIVITGADQATEFNENWWKGFPDATTEILELHVTDDAATEIGVFRGTHTGTFPTPMGDVPATGRSVTGEYVNVFRMRGDAIVEHRLMFDRLDLLEQLGLVPSGAAAAAG